MFNLPRIMIKQRKNEEDIKIGALTNKERIESAPEISRAVIKNWEFLEKVCRKNNFSA